MSRIMQTVAAALTLAGCGMEEGRPLNEEETVVLQETTMLLPEATRFAVSVASQVKQGAMNAQGEESTAQELSLAIQRTSDWLVSCVERGQVLVGAVPGESKVVAEYDQNQEETHRDDQLVLSSDSFAWTIATLIHEAAHKLFPSHDWMFQSKLEAEGASIKDAAFAQDIVTYHDYPYMLTTLYLYVDDVAANERKRIVDALAEAEADKRIVAVIALRKALEMPSDEEVDEEVREWYREREAFYSVYGVTEDVFATAYWESGLNEARSEWREAAVQEFEAESRERQGEIVPRKIH